VSHRAGDVVFMDLDPVVGNERGGRRPAMVISTPDYNALPIRMIMVVPITRTRRNLAHHVPIGTESGLREQSYAMPEYVRAVSTQRVRRVLGTAPAATVETVTAWLSLFTGTDDAG
jgi:mRNA interferase MazF